MAPKHFFQRMLAVAERECSDCEDLVREGDVYFKDKRDNVLCASCAEYLNRE